MGFIPYAIIYGMIAILMALQSTHYYYTVNYPADVARGYIEGVLSSNNINEMKTYLQSGLKQLDGYNGSPVLFPTPYQNFDLIKTDIDKTIKNLDEYQATYLVTSDKSYAYQQTLVNTKTAAETLSSRISETNVGGGFNPYNNPIGYTLLFIFSLAIIPMQLTHVYLENRERRIENEAFAKKYGGR